MCISVFRIYPKTLDATKSQKMKKIEKLKKEMSARVTKKFIYSLGTHAHVTLRYILSRFAF